MKFEPYLNEEYSRVRFMKNMKNEVTVIHTAYEDEPKAVAKVEAGPELSDMGALEYAFRATQNYPELWNTGPFLSN